MKKDTTSKGDVSELEVAMALIRAGRKILRPFSAGLRYDFVIDNEDGTFTRVQCKTGRLKNGFIEFRVSMHDGRRPHGVSYHGQVDAFGVYCFENAAAYLVPMDAVLDCYQVAVLRVAPPKNGQVRGIRYASDYKIDSKPDVARAEMQETLKL